MLSCEGHSFGDSRAGHAGVGIGWNRGPERDRTRRSRTRPSDADVLSGRIPVLRPRPVDRRDGPPPSCEARRAAPLVRGSNAHTPALLEPLLTAPAWLISDTEVAYHVAQTISATAMSLAAIPVYLVCCRLGLRRVTALAAATSAVSLPALMYATTLVAEPFAYPLALGAVAAGTIALGSGGKRAQAAFLIFAAAAAMARAQLLVLPLAYIVAAFVVGARPGHCGASLASRRISSAHSACRCWPCSCCTEAARNLRSRGSRLARSCRGVA
jgi:hypothetical protein